MKLRKERPFLPSLSSLGRTGQRPLQGSGIGKWKWGFESQMGSKDLARRQASNLHLNEFLLDTNAKLLKHAHGVMDMEVSHHARTRSAITTDM